MKLLLLTLLLFASCTSCSSVSNQDESPERDFSTPIQTDKLVYKTKKEGSFIRFEAKITYTNTSDQSAYMMLCYPAHPNVALEKHIEGQWEIVFEMFCETVTTDTTGGEVKAGAIHDYDIILDWAVPPSNFDTLRTDQIEGIYRISNTIRERLADGRQYKLLNKEQRVSNPFRLIE